jgi:hypothetical protein
MKNAFLFLFLAVISSFIGQKKIVKLEIDPKVTKVGEEILVTVKTNIHGEIDIDFPSAFINGYAVMKGMGQEIDYSTGKVISYYYYSQNGVLKKEGTYTFGPAYVKAGSKIYKSNTVEVTIQKEPFVNSSGEISAKQLKQVAFGVIEYSKKKIYEGEPLILNAKIYSRFSPTHIEDYQTYNADGILDKHELSSSNRLIAEQERVKNIDFYSVTHDRSLVFPNGSGKLQIDPFKLVLKRGFEGVPVVSSGTVIDVLPLPKNQPKSFIGMVGQLDLECQVSKTDIKKGDVFSIKLILSGSGNLHNIDYPKLNLPKGLTRYGDPKVNEKYTFTSNGATGKISLEYTVQVNKEGSFNIQPIEVGYFDTKSAKYVVLKSAPINLKGNLIEVAKSNSNGTTKVITESKIDSNNTGGESNVGNNEEFLWISISSLILIAGFIFFAGRIKKPTKIAFDDSIVVNEPIITITWKDVDECLSTAKIALENNDRNNFLLALENALLIALKVTLNEQYTHKTTKELIKDLSQKLGENNFLIDLTNSYEICQNARYGFDENSNDLASLLPKIQAQIENLKKL